MTVKEVLDSNKRRADCVIASARHKSSGGPRQCWPKVVLTPPGEHVRQPSSVLHISVGHRHLKKISVGLTWPSIECCASRRHSPRPRSVRPYAQSENLGVGIDKLKYSSFWASMTRSNPCVRLQLVFSSTVEQFQAVLATFGATARATVGTAAVGTASNTRLEPTLYRTNTILGPTLVVATVPATVRTAVIGTHSQTGAPANTASALTLCRSNH